MAQRGMLGQRLSYSACWRTSSDLMVRSVAVRWDMGTAGAGGFQRAVLVMDRLRCSPVLKKSAWSQPQSSFSPCTEGTERGMYQCTAGSPCSSRDIDARNLADQGEAPVP